MNKQQTVWSKNISLQQSRNWKLGHGVTYVKRPQYDLLKGFSQRKIIACRILQQWQDKKCFLESVPIPLFSLAWTEVQVKLFYTAIGQFPVINKSTCVVWWNDTHQFHITLLRKWSFSIRISLVNLTKSSMENFNFCTVLLVTGYVAIACYPPSNTS